MLRRILLATDGSPWSLKAARTAGALARMVPDAEVTVLYVTHVPKALHLENLLDVPLDPMIRNTARPVLEATLDALDIPQVQVRSEVQIGEPAEEIVEMARSLKFDVIVLGSRGLGPVKELLLGSVSHRVLNTAPCPVLLVR